MKLEQDATGSTTLVGNSPWWLWLPLGAVMVVLGMSMERITLLFPTFADDMLMGSVFRGVAFGLIAALPMRLLAPTHEWKFNTRSKTLIELDRVPFGKEQKTEIPFRKVRAVEAREEEKPFGTGWRIWLVTDEKEFALSWKIFSRRTEAEKLAAQIRHILELPAPAYEIQIAAELQARGYDAAVVKARRELFNGNIIQASKYVNDLKEQRS